MLRKKLYKGNTTSRIPDKHFDRMLAKYDREHNSLEQEVSQLHQAITTHAQDYESAKKFVALVKRHTDFTELSTPMLNEFIEKIIVHEATGYRQLCTNKTGDPHPVR